MPKPLPNKFTLLGPWRERLAVGLPAGAGAYQFLCDQFDFPTLPALWGRTGAGLPWWGWLIVAQSGFLYALYGYVRRRLPDDQAQAVAQTLRYDDTALTARVAELEKIKRAIIDDYQRMCGMEVRYGEAHDHLKRELAALAGVPEKLEIVRVDGAITARNLQELSDTVKEHRERAQGAFLALKAREHLPFIEAEIMQDVADLTNRLRAGECYDNSKWMQWENIHSHWRGKLDEWLEAATWYGLSIKERVNTVDDRKYGIELLIPDANFPNAEAVRRFKKFLIIHEQWVEIVPEVKRGVDQVAFVGLTAQEIRHGRPAG